MEQWVNQRLATGKNAFSLDEVRKAFPSHSETALKYALLRLSDKGSILSIHKGYYLVISPQYSNKGVLPPALFIDGMMRHLDRPYYIGLLNAAVYHGSAHHAPQEFYVFTDFPTLRPTSKKGIKINYISIKDWPDRLIEKRQNEAGYLQISNRVLTAIDLVQYEKRIGGLNRVVEILMEMMESMPVDEWTHDIFWYASSATLQRLGYLTECILKNYEIADLLYTGLTNAKGRLKPVLLKQVLGAKSYHANNRWRVVENITLEIES